MIFKVLFECVSYGVRRCERFRPSRRLRELTIVLAVFGSIEADSGVFVSGLSRFRQSQYSRGQLSRSPDARKPEAGETGKAQKHVLQS